MIYSVWDPSNKVYRYFEGSASEGTPVPGHLKYKAKSAVGYGSDVAWPLPTGARPIGAGQEAKGIVASSSSSLDGINILDFHFPLWAIAAGGAAVLYWYLRR